MKYTAFINIMTRPEILDPQGKATLHGLHQLGFQSVSQVRIGKRISLNLEAASEGEARKQVEKACEVLLANVIMEGYEIDITPVG